MSPDSRAATSFDPVGDLYDRIRPRYPDALFSDLLSIAQVGPHARVLEIGSGTGIATLPVAGRGFPLVGLEPGARMAALARASVSAFPRATIVETTFEDWRGEAGTFDLVYSAQAFHWLDPERRFGKVAALLKSSGWLAIFGHFSSIPEPKIRNALDAVYAEHAPTLTGLARTHWYAHDGPIPDLIAGSGLFGPTRVLRHPWHKTYLTADFRSLLETLSDHRLLPEPDRERLLDAIAGVVDRSGGRIELTYDSNLFMARRAG